MKFLNKSTVYLTSFIILFALFLISNLNPTAPQERRNRNALQHEVTVTLKLVQVYVTDKKGNPVLDLKKEDFLIYDNGKKQFITEFERHILQLPSAGTETQPEIVQESKLPPPRELISRKFFLLFDFAYNNAKGIKKAKRAALHFIDTQVQPSDEVGVLSYSAIKSLKLHEYLTTEHKEVRRVVESFGIKDIAGRTENFEEEYWFEATGENPLDASKGGKITFKEGGTQSEEDPTEESPPEPSPEWEKFKAQEDSGVYALYFVQKIGDFAKALRYVPGYKHIILFSSGIPYSLLYGIHHPAETWNVTRGRDTMFRQTWDLGNRLLQQRYEDMLKELAASNSTVYTLDTEDLASTITVDSRLKGGFTLQTMASSTGGKYFGDINSYEKHLERIQDLTGCYYVVGYYIDEQWDGEYHRIKVKVERPGCEVHAQRGYFNPKPFGEYSKLEKMLHLVDLALNERPLFQAPIRFPLTTLLFPLGKEMNLCLVSKVSLEKIQDISEGKAEIISVIFDAAENIVEFTRQERDLTRFPENNVYYYSLFSLPPGEYKCRLVIRNLETGRGAVAASPAVVFERQEKGIDLLPPLLLVSEKNAIYVKDSVPRGKGGSFSLPDYYHFDSARYAPLVEEELRGNSVVSAVVAYFVSGIPEPEVMISASLIEQSSGEIIPLRVLTRSEAKEEELILRFVEIQIPALSSGEYALNLFAEETKSQSASQVTKSFKVK